MLYMKADRIISFGKQGIKSEGYIITEKNGKKSERKLRADYYAPISGITIIGTAKKEEIFGEAAVPIPDIA